MRSVHPLITRTLWMCIAWLGLCGCVDPQVRRGRDALGQGRYTEALVTLRAVQSRADEGLPDVSKALASACRARADELMELGACGPAAALIREADEHTPPVLSDHRALYRCVQAHPTDTEDILMILQRLVKVGERHGPVLKTLVRHVLRTQDHASVMTYAPMALARFALEPDDARAVGFVFASANRPKDALTYFWHYMQADDSDPLVRLKVAGLYAQIGDVRSARETYDALVRDFPNHPVVHLRLANFCRQHGDAQCARFATDHANRLRGTHSETRQLRPLPKSRR